MMTRDAIVALEIRLATAERTVFHLLVHLDGTIQRQGTARLRDPVGALHVGRTEQPILRQLVDALPDAILDQPGSYAIPGDGTPLLLRIELWTIDAAHTLAISYGADGEGPPQPIVDFVLQARAASDAWYRQSEAASAAS